jgi:hypothetical protein
MEQALSQIQALNMQSLLENAPNMIVDGVQFLDKAGFWHSRFVDVCNQSAT